MAVWEATKYLIQADQRDRGRATLRQTTTRLAQINLTPALGIFTSADRVLINSHSQNASTILTAVYAATNSFRGCSTTNSTRLRSNCSITKGFSLCLTRPVLLRLDHTRHYIKSNRQRMQTHAKRAKKAVARID